MTPLTPPERLLGILGLLMGAALLGSGLVLTGLGRQAGPLGLAVGACLLMVALDPRRNRPYALPAVLGLAGGAVTFPGIFSYLGGLLAFVVGIAFLWSRRAINGSWLHGGPPIS